MSDDPYDLVVNVYGTHKYTPQEMLKIEEFFHSEFGLKVGHVQHVKQEMRINLGGNNKVLTDQDEWLKEQGLL